jgi:hypothetical protein
MAEALGRALGGSGEIVIEHRDLQRRTSRV